MEHVDRASIEKALAFKLPMFSGPDKGKGIMARFSSKDMRTSA